MSLFGSSPDNSNLPKQSAGAASTSSLFDDQNGNGDSPWSMPTPKKSGRGNLVKTLLPASDVPESYIDAYDILLDSGYREGSGSIGLSGARKVFEGSGLNEEEQNKIFNIVIGGQEPAAGLTRSQFNVLLALIGLCQEKEDATLDGVDERRTSELSSCYRLYIIFPRFLQCLDLPQPSLPFVKNLRTSKNQENLEERSYYRQEATPSKETTAAATPLKSRRIRRDSLDNLDNDPWGSPAMHKGHTHTVNNDATPSSNGVTAARPIGNGTSGPARTTSAFTTHSEVPTSTASTLTGEDHSGGRPADGSGGGWDSYRNSTSGFPSTGQTGLGAAGFGSGLDGPGENNTVGSVPRSLGGGRTTNRSAEEIVSVTLLPEKEGMFMFQHHNYEVKSARRGSSVVRRYSDFVWLLDCLHKRYPFRQLPLLPPKRVAGKITGSVAFVDTDNINKYSQRKTSLG